MTARRNKNEARRAPATNIEENARAGRHADQVGAGRTTEEPAAPLEPDAREKAAYRAERDRARARGQMQGIEPHDKGHYQAAASTGEGDPHDYPPGFNWGPRSGYAEEQVSGTPYNLSDDGDSFVKWRERRLQEVDRAFLRWRAELAHQLDGQYKRWIDAQQQSFADDLDRWQSEREGVKRALSRGKRKR